MEINYPCGWFDAEQLPKEDDDQNNTRLQR